MGTPELRDNMNRLGVELEQRPAERIVITGYSQLTPLGGTEETWQGLLEGRSSIKSLDVPNFRVRIGGEVDFNAEDHFSRREIAKTLRKFGPINAISIHLAREALRHAGLTDENGIMRDEFNKRRVGTFVGTGFGGSDHIIDIWRHLHLSRDAKGRFISAHDASETMDMYASFKFLMEEINGQIAIDHRLQGWSTAGPEACATGGSMPVEGTHSVADGRNLIAVMGGLEDPLRRYPEVVVSAFERLPTVLSARNEDPEGASRPYDALRDGFVVSSGGAVIIAENYDHAVARGAKIHAEVLGYHKAPDGGEVTAMDSKNVARVIGQALVHWKHRDEVYIPDGIFAHATSTILGDREEIAALKEILSPDIHNIPISAIKSELGHLLGGAGAVNIVAAIQALNSGLMPPIRNLENRDEIFNDVDLVVGEPRRVDLKTALSVAYGFGGFNSAILLGKYEE